MDELQDFCNSQEKYKTLAQYFEGICCFEWEVFKMSMVETSTGRNTDTETPTGRNTDMVETPTWSKHRQVEI